MVINGRMAYDFSRLENWKSGRGRGDIIRYPARRKEHRSFESFLYLGACMVYSEYSVSRKVVCFQRHGNASAGFVYNTADWWLITKLSLRLKIHLLVLDGKRTSYKFLCVFITAGVVSPQIRIVRYTVSYARSRTVRNILPCLSVFNMHESIWLVVKLLPSLKAH